MDISNGENESAKAKELEASKISSPEESLPNDNFYLTRIMFIFIGIITIMPYTFFVTANEYWMYKFRDPSTEIVDSTNRTVLQANFASGQTIASTLPKILFTFLYTFIKHKINVKTNIFVTIMITISCFVIFTGLIGVDTDSWQTAFFGLTMGGISIINVVHLCVLGATMLLYMSSLVVIAKFPPSYVKSYLLGQGMTGSTGSILQVISISTGTSTQVSAFIYFITGTLIILTTLILYFVNTRMPFYKYYVEKESDDKKENENKSYSFTEIKEVSKEVWTAVTICCLAYVTLFLTHTNMTSLVVSEGYGQGNLWNDKYFVPVITFLMSDLTHLFGRSCATDFIKGAAAPWLVLVEAFRMALFVPLIMFCNILPRHHLSVLFPHDWQYILILLALHSTSGFVVSSVYLSIPRLTKNEELGYLIMTAISTLISGIGSFVGAVAVNLI